MFVYQIVKYSFHNKKTGIFNPKKEGCKMLKKLWTNGVWLMWCMALLSAVGAVNYPPLAGAQGVDSYTKLMLHADGSDQGTTFTDSETTPKTVTNTETYNSYIKLMQPCRGDLFVETHAEIEKSSVGAACNTPMLRKYVMNYGQDICLEKWNKFEYYRRNRPPLRG